jgi:hypothetical protein
MFAQVKVSREHRTLVIFGQGRLEIGGGDLVWASLVSAPLREEAIAQAQHRSENRHRVSVTATGNGRRCARHAGADANHSQLTEASGNTKHGPTPTFKA